MNLNIMKEISGNFETPYITQFLRSRRLSGKDGLRFFFFSSLFPSLTPQITIGRLSRNLLSSFSFVRK